MSYDASLRNKPIRPLSSSARVTYNGPSLDVSAGLTLIDIQRTLDKHKLMMDKVLQSARIKSARLAAQSIGLVRPQHDSAPKTVSPLLLTGVVGGRGTKRVPLTERRYVSLRKAGGVETTMTGKPSCKILDSTSLNGSVLADYVLGGEIGRGAYACARVARHIPSDQTVAVKMYEKTKLADPIKRRAVKREIQVLSRLSHPHIVAFIDAIDSTRNILIIAEFVGGGNLSAFSKKFPDRKVPENIAQIIFSQLADALRYLHGQSFIHRDIKLENVLLEVGESTPRLKLIDFGFASVVIPGRKIKVFCGTPSYFCPSLCTKSEGVGFASDVWASGVLLYSLLCGLFPFKGATDNDLFKAITKGAYLTPSHLSQNAINLLSCLLEVDHNKRATFHQAIAHPWLLDVKSDTSHHVAEGFVDGESEAVIRLEKLGYSRDVIIAQLKDHDSHLFKVYSRFIEAISPWNTLIAN